MTDSLSVIGIFDLIDDDKTQSNASDDEFPEFCFTDEDYMAYIDAEGYELYDSFETSTQREDCGSTNAAQHKTEILKLDRFGWRRCEQEPLLGKRKRYVYAASHEKEISFKGVIDAKNLSTMIDDIDIKVIEELSLIHI